MVKQQVLVIWIMFKSLTDLGQSVSGMVTQSAHEVAGVIVIIRMAPKWRRVAQILAILSAINGLIHGVDSLENFALHAIVNT